MLRAALEDCLQITRRRLLTCQKIALNFFNDRRKVELIETDSWCVVTGNEDLCCAWFVIRWANHTSMKPAGVTRGHPGPERVSDNLVGSSVGEHHLRPAGTGGEIAECAHWLATIRRSQGIAAVLDQPPAVLVREGFHGRHVEGVAQRVCSPSVGDVNAATASRLAEDPEFTRMAWRTPHSRANSRSNCSANRPVVSQKSSDASTKRWRSVASKTRPATGTGVWPGTNSRGGKAAAWYSATSSRMRARSKGAWSVTVSQSCFTW